MLHPTSGQELGNGNDFDLVPMEQLADANTFIVLWPVATQSPVAISQITHQCTFSIYWEAFDLSYIWGETSPPCGTMPDPDDSGFIASLIRQMKTTYSLSTVYVTGMSSGAFMAERVAFDPQNQGLVQAVGAASGQIWAAKHNTIPKMPAAPSSPTVLMLNGDNDNVVVYCGQPNGTGWGGSDFPSSDVSLNYWASNKTCQPVSHSLCTTSGVPTPNLYQVHCQNVAFMREPNVCHTWVPGTESVMWTFFTTGVLPPPPPGRAPAQDSTCLH
jgi:poly(3-hydroxybutyrate) depolymerase